MLFRPNFFEPFAHVHRAKRPLYILPQTVNRSHKIPNRPPLAKPYVNHQSEARKNTLLTRIGYGKFYATQITIRNDYATADDGPFPLLRGTERGRGDGSKCSFRSFFLSCFVGETFTTHGTHSGLRAVNTVTVMDHLKMAFLDGFNLYTRHLGGCCVIVLAGILTLLRTLVSGANKC